MGVRDKDFESDMDMPDFGLKELKCPKCGSSKFAVHGEMKLGAKVDVEYIEEQEAYEERIIDMETANDQAPTEQSIFKGFTVECHECKEPIVSELNEGIARLKEAIEVISKLNEPMIISVVENLRNDLETLEEVEKELGE